MKRLVRPQNDKKLSGLCAGIAEYVGMDVTVIRLIVLTTVILTGVFPGLLIYIIASVITPIEGSHNA